MKLTENQIATDVSWTRTYIQTIKAAVKAERWDVVQEFANEISAIWGTIAEKASQSETQSE